MAEQSKQTLGQSIDMIIKALEATDKDSRLMAIQAACHNLHIPINSNNINIQPTSPTDLTTPSNTPPPSSPPTKDLKDIRTLKKEKNPKNSIQMTCLVAYYLENHAPSNERKKVIKVSDIEKYFKQADFRLPKNPRQSLIDTKAAGYLDNVGTGSYKLNPVGHNLVAHTLPKK